MLKVAADLAQLNNLFMKFSQRIDRAEHDFYLAKLLAKGWKKVACQAIVNGHEITLSRCINGRIETMKCRMMSNGWITMTG